jgi:hypothetical protein
MVLMADIVEEYIETVKKTFGYAAGVSLFAEIRETPAGVSVYGT